MAPLIFLAWIKSVSFWGSQNCVFCCQQNMTWAGLAPRLVPSQLDTGNVVSTSVLLSQQFGYTIELTKTLLDLSGVLAAAVMVF